MKRTIFNTSTRLILLLTLVLSQVITSCKQDTNNAEDSQIKAGTWRVALQAQGQEIPFIMEAENKEGKQALYLVNGDERIMLDEIKHQGDSLRIGLHTFEADLIAKVEGGAMNGRFVKNDATTPYSIPFTAEIGKKNRFKPNPEKATFNFDGKWEVVFTDRDGKSYDAIGIFNQTENRLTGTFLTETGDYRYLEGQVDGNQLKLSTFDGNHAYLFTATPTNAESLKGKFFSGLTGYETWTASRNNNAKLTDADSLTFLKPGYDKLSFTFPDINGKPVSISDPKYKGKVVIVQLLGSWCPNCMDETAFLSPYYDKNKDRGLEIIGLGFERSPEFAKASARLQKMKDRFDIDYDLLVAGVSDKVAAAKALPALNQVMSFPTTIFIDREGKVRKIHTGFSGPGTGRYYDEFVTDFNSTVDSLLAEQ